MSSHQKHISTAIVATHCVLSSFLVFKQFIYPRLTRANTSSFASFSSLQKRLDVKDCKEDRYLDFSIDSRTEQSLRQGLYYVCSQLYFQHYLPDWKAKYGSSNGVPEEFKVGVISGGITNQLYRCSLDSMGVLLRVYGAQTEKVIDRARENLSMRVFSRIGFVYGRCANGRLEQLLSGRNLLPEELMDPKIVPMLAARVAELHSLPIADWCPSIKRTPTVFSTLDQWLNVAMSLYFDPSINEKEKRKDAIYRSLQLKVIQQQLAVCEKKLVAMAERNEAADRARGATRSSLVFCHNDLLAGNVMYDKDAPLNSIPSSLSSSSASDPEPSAPQAIRLIDFEYSAYNYREFELANHFCECSGFDGEYQTMYPKKKQQLLFFQHYLEALAVQQTRTDASSSNGNDEKRPEVSSAELDEMYRRVNSWSGVDHLFWGLWAVVQSKFSVIDFDYLAYAQLRLAAFWFTLPQCIAMMDDTKQCRNEDGSICELDWKGWVDYRKKFVQI